MLEGNGVVNIQGRKSMLARCGRQAVRMSTCRISTASR
jgi:hypothetical protein